MDDFLLRLVRGGSWNDHTRFCRSAYRGPDQPGSAHDDVGFRVVRLSHANDHTIRLEEQAND